MESSWLNRPDSKAEERSEERVWEWKELAHAFQVELYALLQVIDFIHWRYNVGRQVRFPESAAGLCHCCQNNQLNEPSAMASSVDTKSSQDGRVLVGSITVPTDGSSVTFTEALDLGAAHFLVATGTLDINGPGDSLADAEYADFSNPLSSLLDNCNGSPSGTDLGIGVDDPDTGASSKQPDWGPYRSFHTYKVDYVGLGTPPVFNYHDCNLGDNSGSLTVAVYKVVDLVIEGPIPGTAGMINQLIFSSATPEEKIGVIAGTISVQRRCPAVPVYPSLFCYPM